MSPPEEPNGRGVTSDVDNEEKFGIEYAEFSIGDHQDRPTEAELRAVRWKIDLRLMPLMSITYAIQYYGAYIWFFGFKIRPNLIDKSVLNQASLFGILSDLGLSRVVSDGPPLIVDTSRYSYGMANIVAGAITVEITDS